MFNFKNRPAISNSPQWKLTFKNQRGVVMIIALIVLIAMSLAGVALVRSVDTANLVAGNIAFKQGALQEGNAGMEAAIQKFATGGNLVPPPANTELLWTDIPNENYRATVLPSNEQGIPLVLVNKADFDASADFSIKKATNPLTKNEVRYVIERLCLNTGDVDTDSCRFDESGGSAIDQRQAGLKNYTPLYRITNRVDGPSNTVSYTQAVVASSTTPGT
ncbi:MAG: hypothetical protein WCD07_08130 [Burkholderiales bacterium]